MKQAGLNLEAIRTQKGWSIATLAVLSGVDEALIAGIEKGNTNFYLSTIFDIAAVLNVDFRQILVDPTDPRWSR